MFDPARVVPPCPEALLAALEEGVVLHAADGTILGCNRAAERLLHAQPGELAGHASLFPLQTALEDDGEPLAPAREPAWELLLAGGGGSSRLVRVVGEAGERRLVLRAVRLREPVDDAFTPCLATIVGPAAEPPPEPAVAARVRLETVGLLATSVAHQFNNLLTVILGYSEMMQLDLEPGVPAWRQARDVHEAAERGARLTQDLLAVSRGLRLDGEPYEIDGALAELEPLLVRVLGAGRVLELAPGAPGACVRTERALFEQVLVKVLENARRATAPGGRVRIATRPMTLALEFVARHGANPAGEYVQVEIRDDGIGMAPRARLHGFDPFVSHWGGRGIGLALVSGVVNASGGCVEAGSAPDQGTVLRVYLPTCAPADDVVPAGDATG
jgi:two-component system cell cycle sensor histidine kinase/response regulator CckA